MNSNKVKALREMPPPTSKAELKTVLGMITYLQKFAPNMAELTKPMRQLLWRELSGTVLDSRSRGRGFEPHRRHCVVSLSKNINPSLVLVQPRKT